MKALAITVLAGCWSSAAVPPPKPSVPAGPPGPAPSVRWIDNGFELERIPAISRDGQHVLIGIQDNDGGRGWPNLRFEVRNRDNRPGMNGATHVVLKADDAEGIGLPAIKERIASGNRWIAGLHATAAFEGMTKLELPAATDSGDDSDAVGYGETKELVAGDVHVHWVDNALKISKGTTILVETKTAWAAASKPRPMCKGCEDECSNPAFLMAASIDLARKLAVVTVGYTGSDTCWEPPDEHHVVTW